MDDDVPKKDRHPWLRVQFGVAIALIVLGLLCWHLGLAVGLGVGDSPSTSDDWLDPIAEGFFVAGPLIVGGGLVWLSVLVVWLLVFRVRRFLS